MENDARLFVALVRLLGAVRKTAFAFDGRGGARAGGSACRVSMRVSEVISFRVGDKVTRLNASEDLGGAKVAAKVLFNSSANFLIHFLTYMY